MGNENSSQPNSLDLTPTSEYVDYMSNQSIPSRRWSNASSIQNSPVTPPEPDLSHLTEEERMQIASVIARAKALEQVEDERIGGLESDISQIEQRFERKTSIEHQQEEKNINTIQLCPVCHVNAVNLDSVTDITGQIQCSDCERIVCEHCAELEGSMTSSLQDWLCIMCHKRRHLVQSSGLWFHGFRQRPNFKQLDTLPVKYCKRGRLERTTSMTQYDDYKEHEDTKDVRNTLSRQGSLPSSLDDPEATFVDRQSLQLLREHVSASKNSIKEELNMEQQNVYSQLEPSFPPDVAPQMLADIAGYGYDISSMKKDEVVSDLPSRTPDGQEGDFNRSDRPRTLNFTRQEKSQDSESPLIDANQKERHAEVQSEALLADSTRGVDKSDCKRQKPTDDKTKQAPQRSTKGSRGKDTNDRERGKDFNRGGNNRHEESSEGKDQTSREKGRHGEKSQRIIRDDDDVDIEEIDRSSKSYDRRDRDRDHERSRSERSDRTRTKARDRDRDREHKKSRNRDRDRDRDRDGERGRDADKEGSRSSGSGSGRERSKDKADRETSKCDREQDLDRSTAKDKDRQRRARDSERERHRGDNSRSGNVKQNDKKLTDENAQHGQSQADSFDRELERFGTSQVEISQPPIDNQISEQVRHEAMVVEATDAVSMKSRIIDEERCEITSASNTEFGFFPVHPEPRTTNNHIAIEPAHPEPRLPAQITEDDQQLPPQCQIETLSQSPSYENQDVIIDSSFALQQSTFLQEEHVITDPTPKTNNQNNFQQITSSGWDNYETDVIPDIQISSMNMENERPCEVTAPMPHSPTDLNGDGSSVYCSDEDTLNYGPCYFDNIDHQNLDYKDIPDMISVIDTYGVGPDDMRLPEVNLDHAQMNMDNMVYGQPMDGSLFNSDNIESIVVDDITRGSLDVLSTQHDTNSLNIAAYAAAISSNTAQLTNLSVSPTDLMAYRDSGTIVEPVDLSPTSSQEDLSQFAEEELIEFADPSQKDVEQGAQRQKSRPPTSDWSPVIDLSPIEDVSPSIEEAEEEEMYVVQSEDYTPLPGLKRYQNFDDISQLQNACDNINICQMEDMSDYAGNDEEKMSESDIYESEPVPAIVTSNNNNVQASGGSSESESTDTSSEISVAKRIHRKLPQPTQEMLSNAINTAKSSGTAFFRQFQQYLNKDAENEASSSVKRSDIIDISEKTTTSQASSFSTTSISDSKLQTEIIEQKSETHVINVETSSNVYPSDVGLTSSKQTHSESYIPVSAKQAQHIDYADDSRERAENEKNKKLNRKEDTFRKSEIVDTANVDREHIVPPKIVVNTSNRVQEPQSSGLSKYEEPANASLKEMKSKPHPLKLIHAEGDEENASPQYWVLKSPVTPEAAKKKEAKSYDQYDDGERGVTKSSDEDNPAFIYPSPVTPPDSNASPPKPQSPSLPIETNLATSNVDWKRTSSVTTASTSVASSKNESPGQPGEGVQKKIRRKLPPLPPGVVESPVPSRNASERTASEDRDKPAVPPKPVRGVARKNSAPRNEVEYNRTEQKPAPKAVVEVSKERVSAMRDRFEQAAAAESPPPPPIIRRDSPKRSKAQEKRQQKTDENQVPSDIQPTPKPQPIHDKSQPASSTAKLQPSKKIGETRQQKTMKESAREETISIRGIHVPKKVKVMKDLVKDELKLVTYSRKRQIEELEEIRTLEKQLDDIRELERQQREELQMKLADQAQADQIKQIETMRLMKSASHSPLLSGRISPHVSPSRFYTTRQNSDPLLAKFSPIEEYKDIEKEYFRKHLSRTKYRSPDTVALDNRPIHRTGLNSYDQLMNTLRGRSRDRENKYARSNNRLSRSSEYLTRDSGYETYGVYAAPTPLAGSRSERSLLTAFDDDPISYYGYTNNQRRYTRDKSPGRISDITGIRYRSQSHGRVPEMSLPRDLRVSDDELLRYDIWRYEDEVIRKRYRDANAALFPSDSLPKGIIKPIADSPIPKPEGRQSRRDRYLQSSAFVPVKSAPSKARTYSSSEYLSHRGGDRVETTHQYYPVSGFDQFYSDPRNLNPQRTTGYNISKDSGMSSGRIDDFSPVATDTNSEASINDKTPAMPLLGDLTGKSRKRLHHISSSRPTSGEFDAYFELEGLYLTTLPEGFNDLHRTESDISFGGDSDEPIMEHMTEGGVTILRRKPPCPQRPKKYPYQTKRILLTRDPNRSLKGNGLGMKIIGGKIIPGTMGNTTGAFVQTIYPGGVGEQLHGELQEGDQILEWNGIELSGKSYEEVQQITTQPNGEIDLVVKAYPASLTHSTSKTSSNSIVSTLKSDSCHSLYDNIDFTSASDHDDYDSYFKEHQHGVDPSLLAAHLEGIKNRMSPGISPTSSQHEMNQQQSTPKQSHEKPRQEKQVRQNRKLPQSSSQPQIESAQSQPELRQTKPHRHHKESRQQKHHHKKEANETKPISGHSKSAELLSHSDSPKSSSSHKEKARSPKPNMQEEKYIGEIQLQFDFDDYDESLSVHVVKAKDLVPKSGGATVLNPYVKMFLLPGRGPDNRRKTKFIPDTTDPEWHHTLVFMTTPRSELKKRTLEITVWNYEKGRSPHDNLGEVDIEFADSSIIDNKPHWYKLRLSNIDDTASDRSTNVSNSPSKHSTGRKHKGNNNDKHNRSRSRSPSASRRDASPRTPNHRVGHKAVSWRQYLGFSQDHEMLNILTLVFSGGCCGRANRAGMGKMERLSPRPRRKEVEDQSSSSSSEFFSCNRQKQTSDQAVNSILETNNNSAMPFLPSDSDHRSSITSHLSAVHSPTVNIQDRSDVSTSTSANSFETLSSNNHTFQNPNYARLSRSYDSGPFSLQVYNAEFSSQFSVDSSHSPAHLKPGLTDVSETTVSDRSTTSSDHESIRESIAGEILIHIRKDLAIHTMSLTIVQCRKIKLPMKLKENSQGVYAKVYLIGNGQYGKFKKRRTQSKKFCLEPLFQESFSYTNINEGNFLQISLWTEGNIFNGDHNIGQCIIDVNNIRNMEERPINDVDIIDVTNWYKLMST
ncbi:uncharacterized protein LOC141901256 [Tubulanus polymorphus]|uniref:uncharacterized protein LOC141901256 n=1 Tax=Tubulanus polymorphus TaxID=672921 RepID=UPI003DA3C60C